MTRGDWDAFLVSFNRLTLALPNRASDETRGERQAAAKLLYFETLLDLPLEAVAAGAEDILRSEVFFPAPVEWRHAALRAKYRFSLNALPAESPTGYLCETCQDTGLERKVCRVGARCLPKHLDRPEDFEHTYATPCACRDTNVAYQRDRALSFGASPRELGRDEAKQLLAQVESGARDPRMAAAGRDE
jgi:hypothetical protein